jgi:large subunit ribosomal protein L4
MSPAKKKPTEADPAAETGVSAEPGVTAEAPAEPEPGVTAEAEAAAEPGVTDEAEAADEPGVTAEAPAEPEPGVTAGAEAADEPGVTGQAAADTATGDADDGGAAAPPRAGRGAVDVELPAEIFNAKVNVPLIHQVVVAQQAAARQGTHATKTRGAIRGGGKKPYRQKGTGRARQGSIRAPQFAGGGIVHGPQPRSYEQRTPKKMKAAALRGALSDRARHGRVHVVTGLVDGDRPRTRDAVATLAEAAGIAPEALGASGAAQVLVVAARGDELTWKSLRNARGVHLLDAGQLNTYDVLVSDHVVFTRDALDAFVARAAAGARQED